MSSDNNSMIGKIPNDKEKSELSEAIEEQIERYKDRVDSLEEKKDKKILGGSDESVISGIRSEILIYKRVIDELEEVNRTCS